MILWTEKGIGQQTLDGSRWVVEEALCLLIRSWVRESKMSVVERSSRLPRASLEIHRLVDRIWQRPGLGFHPSIGAHQEHTHCWAIHDPVRHLFEPVIIPVKAIVK